MRLGCSARWSCICRSSTLCGLPPGGTGDSLPGRPEAGGRGCCGLRQSCCLGWTLALLLLSPSPLRAGTRALAS
ncbi:hypothetical protein GQ53DRAFT_747936 [Thozetella sp. PMI_491]|nr:hypothetical protein GQ53DRAFT_747936 [Thozetella sp. PMI_491]